MLWVLIRRASVTSNEYPQHRFSWRNKKITWIPPHLEMWIAPLIRIPPSHPTLPLSGAIAVSSFIYKPCMPDQTAYIPMAYLLLSILGENEQPRKPRQQIIPSPRTAHRQLRSLLQSSEKLRWSAWFPDDERVPKGSGHPYKVQSVLRWLWW